jgi:hypothetical protein
MTFVFPIGEVLEGSDGRAEKEVKTLIFLAISPPDLREFFK